MTASAISERRGSSSVSWSSSALGWMPIWRLMMNSSRARPTPALGSCAKENACSGVPTFIMILVGMSGIDDSSVSSTVKSRMPSYTRPVSPSAQETVTSRPSVSSRVPLPVPTTAGMPSSRAMIAAWQVRPPRLVTMAEARFMIGSQSGSVMSATSTSPSLNSCIWSIEVITRAAPAPIFWPIARPSTTTSPPLVSIRKRCCTPARDITVSGRAWRMYSSPSRPSLPHSMSIGRP